MDFLKNLEENNNLNENEMLQIKGGAGANGDEKPNIEDPIIED